MSSEEKIDLSFTDNDFKLLDQFNDESKVTVARALLDAKLKVLQFEHESNVLKEFVPIIDSTKSAITDIVLAIIREAEKNGKTKIDKKEINNIKHIVENKKNEKHESTLYNGDVEFARKVKEMTEDEKKDV